MRVTLQAKLALSFIGLAASVLVASLLLSQWSFEDAFAEYVGGLEQERLEALAERMGEVYGRHGGWPAEIDAAFRRAANQPPLRAGDRPPPDGPRMGPPGPGGGMRTGPHPTALFDAGGRRLAGAELGANEARASVPVLVGGELVGHVQSEPRHLVSQPLERAFSRRQRETSVIIGLVSLLAAVLFGVVLARRLMAPIRKVVGGVSELRRGHYDVTLGRDRDDELGDLMADFDGLADTLRRAREARQRLFADVSHELRTPLTVLAAELEALRDGVRAFDLESVRSLEEELVRLKHLVDDLFELSTSDLGGLRYTLTPQRFDELVRATVQTLPPTPLEVTMSLEPATVVLDRHRMEQLVRNVLLNAMAYTDVPGRIEIASRNTGRWVELTIADTAPSVAASDCERLFEPLFRVEASRSRATAGAGLGLAIARNIARAHGGTITARPSSLGGLEVALRLPRVEAT